MSKKRKILGIMLIFILTFTMLLNSTAAKAAQNQAVPNVDYVNAPRLEYTAGDIVNFDLHASNYGGRVQYRVILWDDNKKEARDFWATGDRYYQSWMPYGNNLFNLHWRIDEPGSYRITVYVKRAGLANSKTYLKAQNCDSYMKSQAFVVKAKATAFDKDGQTYGSKDINKAETYKDSINITAKNVTFNNAKLERNLTITGDNALIRNVNVLGKIIIDPGRDGSCTLDNVTAKEIQVLSGGQNSIHIRNSSAETINVNSQSTVRIEVDGDTEILSTTASRYVIFDRKNGTYGTITIEKAENGETVIEFRGDIKDKVIVETAATIRTGQGSRIANLAVNTGNSTDIVRLEGQYNNVEINSSAKLEIAANTKVENIIANDDAEIRLDDTASITNVEKNNNEVVIIGKDNTGTGTPSTGGDGGGYIPPTVPVSNISVTAAGGASTVVNGQALQMSAVVTPSNATNKTISWTVTPGTGTAAISASGLLTGTGVGTVTVKATNATSGISGSMVVTVEPSLIQLNITPPTLMALKVYDGTTTAVVTAGTLTGVTAGEDVAVSAVASYDNKNVGANKTIRVVYTLSGVDKGKYTKPADYIITTGQIVALPLLFAPPNLTTSKQYDGTTTAAVTPGTLMGVAAGDTVTVNAVANYDTQDTGSGKTITVVYTLSGADAGNYIVPPNYTAAGEITKAQLTITNPALTLKKTYDGNKTAVVTPGTLSGIVAGEDVTVSAAASYDNENAGINKTITVTYTLGGSKAGNYIKPADYTVTTGEITKIQLTIGDPTLAQIKGYDGKTTASVTAGAVTGVIGSDEVTVNAAANYNDKTVGTNKTITVTYTLSGTDEGNYIKPADYIVTTGQIIAFPLGIEHPTLTTSKPYDGTTTAAVTPGALMGVAAGDTVTVNAVASYDTPDIGSGKTITVVYTLSGADAGNYIKPEDYIVVTGEIYESNNATFQGATFDNTNGILTLTGMSGIQAGSIFNSGKFYLIANTRSTYLTGGYSQFFGPDPALLTYGQYYYYGSQLIISLSIDDYDLLSNGGLSIALTAIRAEAGWNRTSTLINASEVFIDAGSINNI